MSWSQPAFESIAAVLSRRTGLSFSPSRRESAEQGIRKAMRRADAANLDAYARLLEVEEAALDDLITELTVGETYFFREPDQFTFLRREVLPSLRTRVAERMPGLGLRAWSAGCASGEEAYSLAMLLESEGLALHSSVLGTDISHAALQRARRALYSSWSLRGESATQTQPYLVPHDARWAVTDAIRRLVSFARVNLALDVYPSLATGVWGMDLIFCRNVLIYFDAQIIEAVARRLFASLAPGGWLFLASSDPPLNQLAPFEIVVALEGVFYHRAATDPVLPKRSMYPSETLPQTTNPSPQVVLSEAERQEEAEEGGPCIPTDLHAQAHTAFSQGEYRRVLELTSDLADDPAVCALHVRALANLDLVQAERACAEAAARHALCAELHYLHGTLLLALGRDAEAARAVRRALYLDRSLAAAHCVLGSILERCGDEEGARRAFRNALELCAARPADEEVPLADGERAGRLAEAARARLALLEARSANAHPSPTTSEVRK